MNNDWITLLQQQAQLGKVLETTRITAQFGLTLNRQEAELIPKEHGNALREQKRVAFGAGITPKIIAELLYKTGAGYVEEKVRKALSLYNEMLPDFACYGSRCLHDTFVLGLPGFFKWYDMKFQPRHDPDTGLLTEQTFETEDYLRIRNAFQEFSLPDICRQINAGINIFMRMHHENDTEAETYFSSAVRNIAIRIKNAAEHEKLNRLFNFRSPHNSPEKFYLWPAPTDWLCTP